MARLATERDFAPTINAYEAWAQRCLIEDASALSDAQLWTPATIDEVRRAFVDHPDMGADDFLTKLKNQMKDASGRAKQLMAEMLWALLLFPSNVKPGTKRQQIKDIWALSGQPFDEAQPLLSDQVLVGIGSGGPGFNNYRWRELVFLVEIAISLKTRNVAERATILENYDAFLAWIDTVPQEGRRQFRHMLRFFAFPDRVERMSSNGERLAVLQGFNVGTPKEMSRWSDKQLDDALLALRQKVQSEQPGAILDFYESPLKESWQTSDEDDETGVPPDDGGEPGSRVWIEKTKVRGRKDREIGEYALGSMLWSPRRSKSGGDIYRFMRDVRPGDVILHLTDNEGFTGLSVADSLASEFDGVPGTAWSNRPSYQIRLRDFRELEPPLLRGAFFASPFAERMIKLIDQGEANLFYNSEPSLNQGAYLTPASSGLVEILADAYLAYTGKGMELPVRGTRPHNVMPEATAREDLSAIVKSFSDALISAHLTFGDKHVPLVRAFVASLVTKRFVILTGLSGSGKSQIAIKFGQWLGTGRHKVVAVRPDWTGPDALFGYEDALRKAKDGRQAWHVPEVLEFMLKAARNPEQPFALVLDEMNLAHVERYFADALSGMETSEPCLPNLTKGSDGVWVQEQVPSPSLPLPTNLFVIGTVNVDETTYLFSPKVLDRANTFEFRVETSGLSSTSQKPIDIKPGDPALVRGFLAIARRDAWHLTYPATWVEEYVANLHTLHQLLSESSLEFGHRVYYEAVRFAAVYQQAGEGRMEAALDRQLLQKILPKIHGSRKRVEATLTALGEFCMDLKYTVGAAHPGGQVAFDVTKVNAAGAQLPLSMDKVQRMTRTLRANQFTSFTD